MLPHVGWPTPYLLLLLLESLPPTSSSVAHSSIVSQGRVYYPHLMDMAVKPGEGCLTQRLGEPRFQLVSDREGEL